MYFEWFGLIELDLNDIVHIFKVLKLMLIYAILYPSHLREITRVAKCY